MPTWRAACRLVRFSWTDALSGRDSLLLLVNSADLADRLVERVFGPLEDNPDLDSTATAAALPVHRNTLLYRIGRIEEAAGLDLQQYDQRELIRLAVMWMDISRLSGR